jgi:hypothetical protein
MSNWYKYAKFIQSTKKVVISPEVKDGLESLGWLDALIKELSHIAPSVQSGKYRVPLSESGGGKDFVVQLEVSPTEVRAVKTFPVTWDESPVLETKEHGSFMDRIFAQKAGSKL